MTFDDDFVRLNFPQTNMERNVTCKSLNLEWPPPEEITVSGFVFRLIRRSKLTDKQRMACPAVMRGAEYEPKYPRVEED